jgi:arsenite methyltransferase
MTLQFSDEAARRLEILYSTPDVRGQRQEALRCLGLLPAERVVDVGCGPGYLAESMADAVTSSGAVLGVDISDDLLSVARTRNARDWLTYEAGDAVALAIPDEWADAVVSMQVLEYLSDPDRGIEQICRILKPSGRALIVSTDWDGVIWHSLFPERMRRVQRAWEDHCTDPRLPRTLAPRLKAKRLHISRVLGYPIINLRLGEDTYSKGLMPLMTEFITRRALIEPAELKAWAAELRVLSGEGRYFFGTMRYFFLVTKARSPARIRGGR